MVDQKYKVSSGKPDTVISLELARKRLALHVQGKRLTFALNYKHMHVQS